MSSKDNEVGYGKPPIHTRFRKGQSGNPKGRPKGVRNFKTDLREELQEFVVIREGTRTLKISKQRAIAKTLTAKTLKGDTRALSTLLSFMARFLLDPASDTAVEEPLNAEEQEILAAYIERVQRRKQLENAKTEKSKTRGDKR